MPIFYEARSTAQGLPEPSFFLGSTLGTSPVEHQDSDLMSSCCHLNIKTAIQDSESNRQLQL